MREWAEKGKTQTEIQYYTDRDSRMRNLTKKFYDLTKCGD